MSLLKNWRTLVAHNPDFALDEGGASKYPAIAAAVATYESALSDWKEVCEKRTARDKNKYHTVRGGYLTEFYPKSVPLPEPESLPATDAILNGTCKSTYPRPRALAAIKNHKDWYAHQELVKARDVHVKNNPSLGDSAVNNREAARFVSASTPFAGKALDVRSLRYRIHVVLRTSRNAAASAGPSSTWGSCFTVAAVPADDAPAQGSLRNAQR